MRKRRGSKYPALAIAISLVILAGIFGYAMRGKLNETTRADEATTQGQQQQAEAKDFAAVLLQACAKKVPEALPYCTRAQRVIEQEPIPGPPGRDGQPGAQGIPGRDGSPGIPGKNGAPGKPGKDATGIPGKDGSPGADGADGGQGAPGADATGIPGQDGTDGADGKDGTNGTDGKDGADGADGKGIVTVECTGVTPQTFRFTFTDGTSQTVECAPAPEPSPTLTPTPDG